MKNDLIYIKHILDAIYKIEVFLEGVAEDDFIEDNDLVQSAVIRQLEIIGEAAKKISGEFKERYPYIPWREMSDTRNKVIHDYFQVDYSLIWGIYQKELPDLKIKIERILKGTSPEA